MSSDKPKRDPRYRSYGPNTWFTTDRAPEDTESMFKLFDGAKSYAAQLEICPKTTRHHWQFFVEWPNPKSFSAMRKLFPGAHLEVSKHPLSAFNYCSDTTKAHVEGTTFKSDPPSSNGQGSRSDLAVAAHLAVSTGIRSVHQHLPATAVRYSHHLMRHVCMVSDTGLDQFPCEVHRVNSIKDVPSGAGEIVKVNGQFRFDAAIDREKVFYYGPLSEEDVKWLSRPYTWLMDVKGAVYPRKFKALWVVGAVQVLPAPTLCHGSVVQNLAGKPSSLSGNSLKILFRMAQTSRQELCAHSSLEQKK